MDSGLPASRFHGHADSRQILAAQSNAGEMLCRHCGEKPGSRVCSGCKNVAYCSADCQGESWKQGHKRLCQGRTSNKPLKPIAPLDPPFVRMSPADERAARTKDPWGLACRCIMTLDNRYIASRDTEIYFAISDPPVLELVPEDLHLSDKCPAIDFPHSDTEILYELTIVAEQGDRVRYKVVVPTPTDFLAANERSCDIGPPYRASEELCNRTAGGLQNSFAAQVFALPQMRRCANPNCLASRYFGVKSAVVPRMAVVASKLVFRTRKPALEEIWAPCCYDPACIEAVRTMLTGALSRDTKK